LDTLKIIEKIIRESAFDKKKKKPGLKFNLGLALTGVRTTGPRGTPSTNVAVAVSYRLNYFVLVLLFCFVDKKNDIKKSCPKSKVEVLLLVCVLSPLYIYVKDMGKHQWTAG